jgi:phage gp46-like protein
MPDIRIVQVGLQEAVTLDWLLSTNAILPAMNGLDETQALATAVTVALCSDRLAETSDALPLPGSSDRKGWWGDDGAADIWNGWPIGSRFWLMSRDKITDSNTAAGSSTTKILAYATESLTPFVDARIISDFDVEATQVNAQRIDVTVTLYRGPLPDIALQFQALWGELTAVPPVAVLPPIPPSLDYSDPKNSMYLPGTGGPGNPPPSGGGDLDFSDPDNSQYQPGLGL